MASLGVVECAAASTVLFCVERSTATMQDGTRCVHVCSASHALSSHLATHLPSHAVLGSRLFGARGAAHFVPRIPFLSRCVGRCSFCTIRHPSPSFTATTLAKMGLGCAPICGLATGSRFASSLARRGRTLPAFLPFSPCSNSSIQVVLISADESRCNDACVYLEQFTEVAVDAENVAYVPPHVGVNVPVTAHAQTFESVN